MDLFELERLKSGKKIGKGMRLPTELIKKVDEVGAKLYKSGDYDFSEAAIFFLAFGALAYEESIMSAQQPRQGSDASGGGPLLRRVSGREANQSPEQKNKEKGRGG